MKKGNTTTLNDVFLQTKFFFLLIKLDAKPRKKKLNSRKEIKNKEVKKC